MLKCNRSDLRPDCESDKRYYAELGPRRRAQLRFWGATSPKPDRRTGERSGNSAMIESSPPRLSTYLRSVEMRRSLRCSRRETWSCEIPSDLATRACVNRCARRTSRSESSSATSSAARACFSHYSWSEERGQVRTTLSPRERRRGTSDMRTDAFSSVSHPPAKLNNVLSTRSNERRMVRSNGSRI